MFSATPMWHPAYEARHYESVGSRSRFHDKWNPAHKHPSSTPPSLVETLESMLKVLSESGKIQWLDDFRPKVQ